MPLTADPNITRSAVVAVPTGDGIVADRRPRFQRYEPRRIVGTMALEEWDEFLEKSKHRYHYVYGKVVQMAGASPEHNLVSMNFAVTLRVALEAMDSPCEVLESDQRVYVRDNRYYFPDLVVVCGAMQIDTRDALRNPAAIVEVLSPTPEADDRTDKFREYQLMPSLRHYILVDQNRVAITHFEKIPGGVWAIVGDYRDLADNLTLNFGEGTVAVPLSRVYRNVTLSEKVVIDEPDA